MTPKNRINAEFINWLGLEGDRLKLNLCKADNELSSHGFILRQTGKGIEICSPSETGLAAGLSELAEFGLTRSNKPNNPDLKYRANQRWLPFDMGQKAYGQAGYDCFDENTNNWWYDKNYWKQYLFESARGRYNAIHLWNVHPYPALIRFREHPYAAYFGPDRVEKNIEQFSWIVDSAKTLGIRIVLMQYNIHVSQGYAKKHKLSWVDDCGWGGEDNLGIRAYTRACVEELLELYPDLGGLMTAGELNKDAFDFYNEAIIPVIKKAGDHCDLHFRLWGQQDTEGVKKLVGLIEGKIQLWHKMSHEQVWVSKADYRIGKWHELTGAPVNAICGPGMAAGLNYVESVHYDPQFWRDQLGDLKQIGGNGIGYFSGDDNYLRFPGDYQKQKHAIEARRLAGVASREVVGKIAWDIDRLENKCRFRAPLRSFLNIKDEKTGIYEVVCEIDSLFTEICQYHGMYESQNLGFTGLLGARTVSTEKSVDGSFPFCGAFAWPNDGFGTKDIKEVRQLSQDVAESGHNNNLSHFEKFKNLIHKTKEIIEDYGLENDIFNYESANDLKSGYFLHNKLVIATIGLIKYYSINAAVYAYGAAFAREPVTWLKKSVDFIDSCLEACSDLKAELANGWNVKLTYAVHSRHSAHYIANYCYSQLTEEKKQLEQIIEILGKSEDIIDRYKKSGRSLHWYYEVFACLPTHGGFHCSEDTFAKAGSFVEKALSELDGLKDAKNSWRSYLEQEKGRFERPLIELGKQSGEKYIELKWDGFGFENQELFTSSILKLLTSDTIEIAEHLIASPKKVVIKTNGNSIQVCFPPLFDPDFEYVKIDEKLAPHEKISPYIYRDDDHYQVSLALPENDKLFNVKIMPKEQNWVCRTAWLNAPHGLCVRQQSNDKVGVEFNDDSIIVNMPWNILKTDSDNKLNIKFNVCQSRDFWEFVVASWSPIQSVQTFLDKDQLGNMRKI